MQPNSRHQERRAVRAGQTMTTMVGIVGGGLGLHVDVYKALCRPNDHVALC